MSAKYIKKIDPFFTDERGPMSYLTDSEVKFPISEVFWIDSKKGAIRANHYHKKDQHVMYLVSGQLEYITKDMRVENAPVEKVVVNPGELIVSPSMIAHKVRFLEDSLIVCITSEPRDRAHYEDDTVRLEVEE